MNIFFVFFQLTVVVVVLLAVADAAAARCVVAAERRLAASDVLGVVGTRGRRHAVGGTEAVRNNRSFKNQLKFSTILWTILKFFFNFFCYVVRDI